MVVHDDSARLDLLVYPLIARWKDRRVGSFPSIASNNNHVRGCGTPFSLSFAWTVIPTIKVFWSFKMAIYWTIATK